MDLRSLFGSETLNLTATCSYSGLCILLCVFGLARYPGDCKYPDIPCMQHSLLGHTSQCGFRRCVFVFQFDIEAFGCFCFISWQLVKACFIVHCFIFLFQLTFPALPLFTRKLPQLYHALFLCWCKKLCLLLKFQTLVLNFNICVTIPTHSVHHLTGSNTVQ